MSKKSKASTAGLVKGRDFRVETYFVGGKMRKHIVRLIEGQPVDEFIRQNADDVYLVQEGLFEILHERELERDRPKDCTDNGDKDYPFGGERGAAGRS